MQSWTDRFVESADHVIPFKSTIWVSISSSRKNKFLSPKSLAQASVEMEFLWGMITTGHV